MARKHLRLVFKVVPFMVALFLTACGGSQLTYQVTGTADQVEVTYTDAEGKAQTETASLPWETVLRAGRKSDFSLIARNTSGQGDLSCLVLLGEKELGRAQATRYVSCEGGYKRGPGSLTVDFRSSSDVLPDGSPAVYAEPAATETPVAEEYPRTNGGGSGFLAFLAREHAQPSTENEIFLLEFDGAGTTYAPLTENIGWVSDMAWSADGARLLLAIANNETYTEGIYVLDLTTSDLTQLIDNVRHGNREPLWSPDGRKIVFTSDRSGNKDIYVMNLDGSGITNLTNHQDDDEGPRWSADGGTVYFISDRKDGHSEIFAMDPDGSNVRQVTESGDDPDPIALWRAKYTVSPHGDQLAFVRNRKVFLVNSDGTHQRSLADIPNVPRYTAREVEWSPDARWFAFEAAVPDVVDGVEQSNIDIFVANADGSDVGRLTTDPADDKSPTWSPDGTMLIFTSNRTGGKGLYLINADGTGLTRLVDREDWSEFSPIWQPALVDAVTFRFPDTPIQVASAEDGAVSAEDWHKQGIQLFNQGDYESAVTAISKAMELEPDTPILYNDRGFVYASAGDYEQAIADYTRAIELDPDYVRAYNNRAQVYGELGDYERSIADYTRSIELDPNYPLVFHRRGLLFDRLEEYEQAIADYTRAIELEPDNARVYNSRGIAYKELEDYEQAIANYTQAIELDPENADPLFNRGIAYKYLEDYERAAADFTRYIELVPDDPDAYFQRGLAFKNLEEYERAISDYTRAIELEPGDPGTYNNRGVVFRELGDYERAIADFSHALTIRPDYDLAYLNRGRAYVDAGQTELAIADFRQVLEITEKSSRREDAEEELRALGVEP